MGLPSCYACRRCGLGRDRSGDRSGEREFAMESVRCKLGKMEKGVDFTACLLRGLSLILPE